MTVDELMEQLRQMEPDAEVKVDIDQSYDYFKLKDIDFVIQENHIVSINLVVDQTRLTCYNNDVI